ncbi:DUF2637 domain-containing protein [Nonomuraea indica]|uniref:DUF2637 domain-containing protein n=1 Tax=Nonomuraea indica TaxID=1581193 RepID=A0ABW8A245_9ACTN
MDVTPPSTLRRLGIALAGVAVAALTGAACALSFDDLRALAIRGEARPDLAYLYPAGFDALLAVALISVLLLRSARLLVRVQAAVVLVLLIVAAAAANVTTALRLAVDVRAAAVGVAVAPWVMLALGLWLWLLLIKHVQHRRAATGDGAGADVAEDDLVPFHRGRAAAAPPLEPPVQPVLEPTPVVGPTAAPETPPVDRVPVTAPQPAPVPDSLAGQEPSAREAPEPVADGASRADTRRSREGGQPVVRGRSGSSGDGGREEVDGPADGGTRADGGERLVKEAGPARAGVPAEAGGATEAGDHVEGDRSPAAGRPVDAGSAGEPERRPVRWGDRVKPTDVLVHPRPVTEKDADTQPVRVFTDRPSAGRGHGPEAAEPAPRRGVRRRPTDVRVAGVREQPAHEPVREEQPAGEQPAPAEPARDTVPERDVVPGRDMERHGEQDGADERHDASERHGERDSADERHGERDGADERDGGRAAAMEDTAPHPVVHDDAPARRMRSTPLPPEE